MMRRQLAPMFATMKTLAALTESDRPMKPLPIASQDEIGELIGAFNRLLEVLEHRGEALSDSEERYRRLFEVETDAIIMVDRKTYRFLDANPAALEMYGYSLEEFLELITDDISAEPEKTRQAVAISQMQVFNRLHRKKDGTVFPVDIAGNYFEYHGREVHVAAIRDITERKRLEA